MMLSITTSLDGIPSNGRHPISARSLRRHRIQPDALPYKTPAGTTYDSGDFPAILDKALAPADWDGFPARRRRVRNAASCAAPASASIWMSPARRPPK